MSAVLLQPENASVGRRVGVVGAPANRVLLFAAARDDPRARRPVDALRAAAWVALILLACVLSVIASDLERELSDVLVRFPGFLRVLWLTGFWGALGWAAALLLVTVLRGRVLLVGEALLASLLGLGAAAASAAIVRQSAGDVFARIADTNGPPVFPHGAIVVTCAVLSTMAPRLVLPLRRVGLGFVAAQVVGALFLGASFASGVIASVAVGLLAGTTLHLVFGSPGGFPTMSRVRDALSELGVQVVELRAVSMGSDGRARFEGKDASGPLDVKVYARDAWESGLLADAWRRLWYRGGQRRARLSRLEYVEHEGFVTFLAHQAGARVPEVVTAGVTDSGDALIVVRPDGVPLLAGDTELSPAELASLWRQLELLHASGVAHHRIDLDRVVRRVDTGVGFDDLASASVHRDPIAKLQDRAQMLALGIVTSGDDAALRQGRTSLGDEGVVEVLPYLQEAAMPPRVRAALRRRHLSLDKVRKGWAAALGGTEPEVVQIQRVSGRSLFNLVLAVIAAYTLIGLLTEIDFGSFRRALAGAHWWWLGAALLVGQLPRLANALSVMGSTAQPLPFGPTAMLEFATCYLNVAMPSTAGRIAMTTRFYQRSGIAPATAVSAGLIDALSELSIQVVLFLLVFFASDVDLGISMDTDQLSGLATTAVIGIAVLVVALVVALLIRPLRTRVLQWIRDARGALEVLRTPQNVVRMFGGNLLSQLLFALTLGCCVRAFGFSVPLSSLILINTAVTLFAGVLPVPGGVGVSEAGLSLGLTRVGVPEAAAFAIALSYRFVTYYLPPLWGYLSYRWLRERRYL